MRAVRRWQWIALLVSSAAALPAVRADDAPTTAPASVAGDPDLVNADVQPDAQLTARLLAMLNGADSLARESAIRRLAPWPGAAAPAVVQLFAAGNLQSRLSAMELLQTWKAPIDGMDPWAADTITPERLKGLQKWASGSVSPTTLPAKSLQAIDPEDLSSLLRAGSAEESRVITERLARAGPALLPLVSQRLKTASSDRDIERLKTLRYRIVAGDTLAASWQGGFERLASSEARTRRGAAEELAQRAAPADAPLLMELFSDADPVMRESSLRALQKIGGPDASRAMVKLLRDPEPNVRAAVLKELAESPSPEMVDDVMQYVATEKDQDLVVHAVRVLRAARSPSAEKCLVELFSHPSWRVRAEAIDSLSDSRQNRKRSDAPKQDESKGVSDEHLQEALIKLMDDSDGYVAGRAIAAIQAIGGQLTTLQPMVDASKRHPNLAIEVIRAVARAGSEDINAIKALREFCKHEDASVRVAALAALVKAAPNNCDQEIGAGLTDRSNQVRIAAANALVAAIESKRPQDGYLERPAFLGLFGGGRVKIEPNQWLDDFRSGKERPVWMGKLIPSLQKMLAGSDAAEQFAAALPLVAMGHDDEAIPVVTKLIRTDLVRRDAACWMLPWLPWNKRLAQFEAFLNIEGPTDHSTLQHLVERMAIWPDARAADPLWGTLGRPDADALVDPVSEALRQIYVGGRYVDVESLTDSQKATIALLTAKCAAGPVPQRTAALAILLVLSAPDAAAAANKIYHDSATPAPLQDDAFHMLLQAQQPEAISSAIAGLKSDRETIRLLSLRFLAQGARNLGEFRDVAWLQYSVSYSSEGFESGKPVVIQAPAGLAGDALQRFVKGDDAESAALAGYLLCVLGDKSGLDPLIRRWRAEGESRRSSDWTRLVYRAISALDDDSKTPVLGEIYASFEKENYYVREFYWTIRSMHGTQILALRKKIRDDVGMEQLK